MANFPTRPGNALSGSQFMSQLGNSDSTNRDELLAQEVLRGNIPNFIKSMVPITITEGNNTLVYYVTPDYLCIGDDQDYVRVPLGAPAAQRIADAFGCMLPTAKMSNQIWKAAKAKIAPKPMSGITSTISGKKYSPQEFLKSKMTDTDSFIEHNRMIQEQLSQHKPGELVAGHKKDVVLSNQLADNPGRVAIHGLHKLDGKAIQGGSWAHHVNYRDYSHGIRLVDKSAQLNGKPVDLAKDILQNPQYASLVSDEGALKMVAYQYDGAASKKNLEVAQVNNPASKGRLQFLQRITDYLDKISIT